MDTISTGKLRNLTRQRSDSRNCVSIYLPTHAVGREGEQDVIRLKNLVDQAELRLIDSGMRSTEARTMLQPARELPQQSDFWKERGKGLAIFVSPEILEQYRHSQPFTELVEVSDRFHVKPLLPLSLNGKYFILTLSQKSARLWEATREGIQEVPVPKMPKSMDEALNYEPVDGTLQFHAGSRGGDGREMGLFHGQGGEADARKVEVAQYLHLVHDAVQSVLNDEEAPLLLAGVEYEVSMYRDINRYPHAVEPQLTGNVDHLSPNELQQRSWEAVEPVMLSARDNALQRFGRTTSAKTSTKLEEIVPAACDGRVDVLFTHSRACQWGVFDPESRQVETHDERQEHDEDLVDRAITETLMTRGTVYPVEDGQLPPGKDVAALFRF